jgi:hypothetical protein
MNRKIGLLTLLHWFTVNCQQRHEMKWQQICWCDKNWPPATMLTSFTSTSSHQANVTPIMYNSLTTSSQFNSYWCIPLLEQQQQQHTVLLHVSDDWKMHEGLLFPHIKGNFHLVIETRWQCCSHNVSTKNNLWLSISFQMQVILRLQWWVLKLH